MGACGKLAAYALGALALLPQGAVAAELVLLQLLERDAERVGQRNLGHLVRKALRADSGADRGVVGGRGFGPAASHQPEVSRVL